MNTPISPESQQAANPAASVGPPAQAAPAPNTSALTNEQYTELEGGAVDLLCKLEFLLSTIKESNPADRNELLPETAQDMLSAMADFSEAFFTGDALTKTNEELSRAFLGTQVLKELVNNTTITGLLRRTFGGTDPNQAVIDEHTQNLFRLLKRAIVTLLFHAIQLVGFDSPLGKQLDQSTYLFVSELESV